MKNLFKFCIESYKALGKALMLIFSLIGFIVTFATLTVVPLVLTCDYRQYWTILLYLITIPLCRVVGRYMEVFYKRLGFI